MKGVVMKKLKEFILLFVFSILLLMNSVDSAEAYIGPGAGFAFLSSFLTFLIAFAIAIFRLFFWPFRL